MMGSASARKSGKRHRKRKQTWSSYVYKVLRQGPYSNLGISSKAMNVINSLLEDQFKELVDTSNQMCKSRGAQTMSSLDVQAAVRLLLPNELAKHAVVESTAAVNKYHASCMESKKSKMGR